MRILVLGGNGMLGHRAAALMSEDHEVVCTLRMPDPVAAAFAPQARFVTGVSVEAPESLLEVMLSFRPEAVINCIGIVKQRDEASEFLPSIRTNALFPHEAAKLCSLAGARFIHVSTDCVFSGQRGGYREEDAPDEVDLYARTKLLGEVAHVPGAVTVRTSIIGWEIREPTTGLLEWFASRRGSECGGYTKAIFSGLATTDLVGVFEHLCTDWSDVEGLWHVSTDPISKYDLLVALRDELGWDVDIHPTDHPAIDRSLDSSRFREHTGWRPRPWAETIPRLAEEHAAYEGLRESG